MAVGLPLPLLVTCSIVSGHLEFKIRYLCHMINMRVSSLHSVVAGTGTVFSSAPDFLLTGNNFFTLLLLLVSSSVLV